MTRRWKSLPILFCILAGGCGFFKKTQSQFFSLATIPPATAAAAASGLPVGIDGVELPPGIDRREIVVRSAGGELKVRGTEQWAAPLEEMVMHTLAFDLANRLPAGMVVLPGQAKPTGAMRSLYVVFEDLAAGEDSEFVLDARWVLTTPGGSERTGRERITVPLPSLDSGQIVTGKSQALATLAERILAAIR